jgi:hypothetical protein
MGEVTPQMLLTASHNAAERYVICRDPDRVHVETGAPVFLINRPVFMLTNCVHKPVPNVRSVFALICRRTFNFLVCYLTSVFIIFLVLFYLNFVFSTDHRPRCVSAFGISVCATVALFLNLVSILVRHSTDRRNLIFRHSIFLSYFSFRICFITI